MSETSNRGTPTPHRIHIIGGPGSGKTTLASRLAVRLNAPAYDLDRVGYEGGAGPKRSLDLRLSDVAAIAFQPTWITEGIYLWWTDELLRTADAIVWLDLPWRVVAWRIVLRHIRASLAGNNPHRGLRKLLAFLRWAQAYYAVTPLMPTDESDDSAVSRAATVQHLAPFSGKLVHCHNSSEIRSFLVSIRQRVASSE